MNHHRRPIRGDRNERGAGLVEFALVALLLFVLSGGAYDYGQAWRSGLAINEAARTGARVGSAMGSDRAADFYALSGLKAALQASGRLDDVERIVVFRADAANGRVPDACKTQNSGANCQIIQGAAFRTSWESTTPAANATTTAGCLNVASSKAWCPTARKDDQVVAEYYGIWIRYRHHFLFPVVGSSTTIERVAVMRIEPRE